MDHELDRFKRDIHLAAFAASRGYRLDRRESSVSSCVLRHDATGDKLIVGKAPDGHWRYFSVRDREDNGTIVDFIQRRERLNLGEIRRELRKWTNTPRPDLQGVARTAVQPSIADADAVARRVTSAKRLATHPYLEARGLRAETLDAPRFRGTWLREAGRHGNVIFPHYGARGLTGFECGFQVIVDTGINSSWTHLDRAIVDTGIAIMDT